MRKTTRRPWSGSIADSFEGGTGTEEDPYLIATGEQLAYLAQEVNNGNSYEGLCFALVDNIVLNETEGYENWETTPPQNEWTPIGHDGDDVMPFSGVFDGKAHTVSGLYISEEYCESVGLFGAVNYGEVRNLLLKQLYVFGNKCVGSVVGSSFGFVRGCIAEEGIVKGGDRYVGGIAGLVGGVPGSTGISNCVNYCDVFGPDSDYTGYDAGHVGGVVGSGDFCADCSNYGNVTGGGSDIGGVVGSCKYEIINCNNSGAVSGLLRVGGIVGCNWTEFLGEGYDVLLRNCKNFGKVTACGFVGGIVGEAGSNVDMCYNYGEIIGINAGDSESWAVGGICGDSGMGNSISKCYNAGEVHSEGRYVGGVTGMLYAELGYCYNVANVSGVSAVGGIVGCGDTEWVNVEIRNCYNLGLVTGKEFVGAILGDVTNNENHIAPTSEQIIDCYCLAGCVTEQKVKAAAVVTALSEADMRKAESFKGFDFENTWQIGKNDNYPYPELKEFPHEGSISIVVPSATPEATQAGQATATPAATPGAGNLPKTGAMSLAAIAVISAAFGAGVLTLGKKREND